jgi:hypothetical protein
MRCLFNIKTFFAKIFVSKLDDYINKNLNSEFFVLFGKKGKKLDATIYHDYFVKTYSYIRDEWKVFCIKNNLKIEYMIRLKFACVNTSHMLYFLVYYIN